MRKKKLTILTILGASLGVGLGLVGTSCSISSDRMSDLIAHAEHRQTLAREWASRLGLKVLGGPLCIDDCCDIRTDEGVFALKCRETLDNCELFRGERH